MPQYIPSLSESALRWARFTGLLVALVLLSWLVYYLRDVFTPLLIAAALAYILNPVVTWIEQRGRLSRLTVVTLATIVLGLVVVAAGVFAGSRLVAQLALFQERLPRYIETLGEWLALVQLRLAETPADPASTLPAATAPHWQAEWWGHVAPWMQEHGVAVVRTTFNRLGHAIANAITWLSLLVLIPLYTFYFLWRFNDLVHAIHVHLPAAHRGSIVHVVRTIDEAVACFFRGRLMVCMAVGAATGIGWTLVGVPFSLPLGLLAGALNLVPFMSVLSLPPALLFTFLGAQETGAPWIGPVLMTMGVYMLVQALESFVLSPWIEGQSSGLHPLVIVVALMIGAQLAGLLGMLLAIPVTSTLKVLAAETVLPEIRRLAGHPAAPEPETPGTPEAVGSAEARDTQDEAT